MAAFASGGLQEGGREAAWRRGLRPAPYSQEGGHVEALLLAEEPPLFPGE